MFYSDWCFACLQVEPIWRRVIEELEPVGFGVATVHAENEPLLARKIGIHSLPCLILLMDGKASVYKETLYSVQKIVGKTTYLLVCRCFTHLIASYLSADKCLWLHFLSSKYLCHHFSYMGTFGGIL
jgi:DnaJ family protein C protein 16